MGAGGASGMGGVGSGGVSGKVDVYMASTGKDWLDKKRKGKGKGRVLSDIYTDTDLRNINGSAAAGGDRLVLGAPPAVAGGGGEQWVCVRYPERIPLSLGSAADDSATEATRDVWKRLLRYCRVQTYQA